MKKLLMLLTVYFSLTYLAAQSYQSLSIGSSLPHATTAMVSTGGKDVSMQEVMGKNGILVMFSCNTCPVVKRYQGRTIQSINHAKENGFGVIVINSNEGTRDDGDSFEAMKRYAKTQGYSVPYVVDKNSILANAFGANRTPEIFLFNSKKQLIYHGAIDDNQDATAVKRNHLAEAIQDHLNGKQVTVNKTRSVGCSIKRVGEG